MAPSVILVNIGRYVSMLLMFGRMCVAEVDEKSEWDAGTKWFEGGTNGLVESQVVLRELSGREER